MHLRVAVFLLSLGLLAGASDDKSGGVGGVDVAVGNKKSSVVVPLLSAVLATLGLLSLLAGCTPTPAPTPTPTAAFASEEEAFAAAEETYRAYNDALNSVDPADPDTFEATYAYSSGSFQKADRENFSTMHADNYSIVGDAEVNQFLGEKSAPPFDVVTALICIDVSKVEVLDAAGNSVVSPNRPDLYEVRAVFKRTEDRFLIDEAGSIEGTTCAGL